VADHRQVRLILSWSSTFTTNTFTIGVDLGF
jgi:hypothetical protein